MPKFYFFIFLLFFVYPLQALEFDQSLLNKADIFYAKGEYQNAEIFYDAYLTENENCEVLFKSGIIKVNLKKYDQALVVFKKITKDCVGKLELASHYYLSLIYLEVKEPGLALISLNNIKSLSPDNDIRDLAEYEKIWLYLRFGKTDKALSVLKKQESQIFYDLKTDKFNKDLNDLNKRYKSPVIAGGLSIIPGAGYIYCNRYKDGVYAFFLNAILISASYEAFDNDLPVLGALTGSVAFGFYSGNIYGGIRACEFENRLYRQKRFNNLEKNYKKKRLGFSLGFNF